MVADHAAINTLDSCTRHIGRGLAGVNVVARRAVANGWASDRPARDMDAQGDWADESFAHTAGAGSQRSRHLLASTDDLILAAPLSTSP